MTADRMTADRMTADRMTADRWLGDPAHAASRRDARAPAPGGALVLAVEAATYVGSAAVLRGSRVLAERTVAMRGEREERLMPAVGAVLADAGAAPRQLDAVVCGGGPGSFTSLRIAGAIAKGIAMAAGRPLVAVPSLALAAARPAADRAPGRWLVALDAMRGERYAAIVTLGRERAGVRVLGYDYLGVFDEATLPAMAARERVLGIVDAGAEPPAAAAAAAFALDGAGAADFGAALQPAAVDLALWEPDYGRQAEAQVTWERQHGRSLPADAQGVTIPAAVTTGGATAAAVAPSDVPARREDG